MNTSKFRIVLTALTAVFMFSAQAFSDVVYISGDELSVNCISLRSSNDFTVSNNVLPRISSSSGSYDDLFAFTHDGFHRLAVVRSEADRKYLLVYDMESQPVLLASCDISTLGLDEIDSFAEDGGKLLIAGSKQTTLSEDYMMYFQHATDDFIAELNPENLQEIRQPYRYSPASQYLSYGYIAGHEGLVYAVYYLYNDVVGGSQRYSLAVIDTPEDITASMASGVVLSEFVSCGGNLYVSTTNPGLNFGPINPEYINPDTLSEYGFAGKMGIYRINHELLHSRFRAGVRDFTLQDYSDRITSDIADTICSDGYNGIYYLVYDYYMGYYRRYIDHWDGNTSERVCDFGGNTVKNLCYDSGTRTLFTNMGSKLLALAQNSSGEFRITHQFDDIYRKWAVIPRHTGIINIPREESKDTESKDVSGDIVPAPEHLPNTGKNSGDITASPDKIPEADNKKISDDENPAADENENKNPPLTSSASSGGGGCSTVTGFPVLLAGLYVITRKK